MATLTIEDGSIVANANSYVTDAEVIAYASSLGYAYNADSVVRCQQILQAMRYVEAFSKQFAGVRTSVRTGATPCQSLSFPRSGVCIDGCIVGINEIPEALKYAVLQTVVEIEKGTALWPQPVTETTITGAIKKKRLGPLVKEYHAPMTTSSGNDTRANPNAPIMIAEVSQYLNCLFGSGASGAFLRTRRA